jgi:predicted nucleic acid-binding protein
LNKNVLVADASILAPAIADAGPDGQRYRRRLRGEALAAPDLAKVEVLSVLRRQVLNGSLAQSHAKNAVANLLALPITAYPAQAFLKRCWELRSNVTPYDASYVALAETLGCQLLTADVRLANAPGPTCPIEIP